MATHHLSTSIEGLLAQNNKLLGDLFDMDGKDARAELLELKYKGHKYVPSDNCTNFDPFEKGCCCGEEKEIKGIMGRGVCDYCGNSDYGRGVCDYCGNSDY